MTPAVFLDRDGVLIEEVNYLAHPHQVRLLPDAAPAIARLNQRNIPVVVVTNQAGVAHGKFPEERVDEVHRYLDLLLHREGARVDRYEFCPHHPAGEVSVYRVDCACRKPRPGMLLHAAAELGLDLACSVLVGDKVSDLEAGASAGCATILVRTGHGRAVDVQRLDFGGLRLLSIVADLPEAIGMWLVQQKYHEHGRAYRQAS